MRKIMPTLNFYAKFAPKIESGEKTSTIRAFRRDGKRPATQGSPLKLTTGPFMGKRRTIRETTCTALRVVFIDRDTAQLDGDTLSRRQRTQLANDDGFDSYPSLVEAIVEMEARRDDGESASDVLPFTGYLIRWA